MSDHPLYVSLTQSSLGVDTLPHRWPRECKYELYEKYETAASGTAENQGGTGVSATGGTEAQPAIYFGDKGVGRGASRDLLSQYGTPTQSGGICFCGRSAEPSSDAVFVTTSTKHDHGGTGPFYAPASQPAICACHLTHHSYMCLPFQSTFI